MQQPDPGVFSVLNHIKLLQECASHSAELNPSPLTMETGRVTDTTEGLVFTAPGRDWTRYITRSASVQNLVGLVAQTDGRGSQQLRGWIARHLISALLQTKSSTRETVWRERGATGASSDSQLWKRGRGGWRSGRKHEKWTKRVKLQVSLWWIMLDFGRMEDIC